MASNLGRMDDDENDFDRQLMRERLRHERVSRAGDSRSRSSQERSPWYPRGQRASLYSHEHPSSSRFISPSMGVRFEGPYPKKFRPDWGGAPSYLAGGQPMSLRIPHFGPGQGPWQPQPDFHNHLYPQRSMPPPSPVRATSSSLPSSKISSTHNSGELLTSERGGGDEVMRKHAGDFFMQHKDEEWFKHKYHPLEFSRRVTERRKMVKDRRKVFERLARLSLFEKVNLEVSRVKDIVKILDAAVILMEGGSESDLKILDEEDSIEMNCRESEKSTMPVKFTEPLKLDETGDRSELVDVPKRVELDTPGSGSISESDEEQATKTPTDGNALTPPPSSPVTKKKIKDGISCSGNKIEDVIVDEEKQTDKGEPGMESSRSKQLHRTVSLFLKNLPTITEKSDIEEICKCYPGFLRVALQDPQCENKFLRRAWVAFEPWVNIKDICWNMSSLKLKDCELKPTVNSELKQRVRTVNGVTCHKSIARQDVKHIVKVIQNLDSLHSVWDDDDVSTRGGVGDCKKEIFGFVSKNPLLKNITDYLVEEGSYEEEALLDKTGSNWDEFDDRPKPAHAEVFIEKDPELLRALDRMIIYLRIVHSLDYYAAIDYLDEGDMPHRCGIVHVRAAKPTHRVTQNDINEWMSSFEGRIADFTEGKFHLTEEEMARLGKDAKIEVEKFITANTQEISKDKWLCPLSGKKFKGPDFVRKHIRTKHADKVDQVKVEVEFFNNYLRDTRRPQLPESQLLQNNPPTLPQNVPTSPSHVQQNTPIPMFIHHHYTQVRRPIHRAGNIVYRPPSYSEVRMSSDVYRPRERFSTGRGRFPRPPTSTTRQINPDNQY